MRAFPNLYNPLCQHRICHFDETGDVGTLNGVDAADGAGAVALTGFTNGGRDAVQPVIDLTSRPREAAGVQGHFQARGSTTARRAPRSVRFAEARLRYA